MEYWRGAGLHELPGPLRTSSRCVHQLPRWPPHRLAGSISVRPAPHLSRAPGHLLHHRQERDPDASGGRSRASWRQTGAGRHLPDNSQARLCGNRELVIDVSRTGTHDKLGSPVPGAPCHPNADLPTKHLEPSVASAHTHTSPIPTHTSPSTWLSSLWSSTPLAGCTRTLFACYIMVHVSRPLVTSPTRASSGGNGRTIASASEACNLPSLPSRPGPLLAALGA